VNEKNMKKIAIIGCCGSGKSTLSRQLSTELNLPLHHLDTLYWKPGWTKTPSEQWSELQTSLCETREWIIDGNYQSTLDIRLNACDTVIFLDVNRFRCIYRALKRTLSDKTRPDMAAGCEERFNLEFIKFIWNFPNTTRPVIIDKISRMCKSKDIIIAKSGAQALQMCQTLSKPDSTKGSASKSR
jgi:adenylate kinase family enzyme